jgi:peptidyl-prolyl cis-trans isomerase SurA
MRLIISVLLVFVFTYSSYSQDSDPILFSVEDNHVKVSEFDYIYNKNNGDGADYKKSSLQEYLDLYLKFKLKVQRAKELKLDTIVSLQKELAGYRRQLADTYLVDKEVQNKMIEEVFERMQTDRRIAHIHVALPEKASEEATNKASAKIRMIKDLLDSGADWDKTALENSEDKLTRLEGGEMGYFTSMLPSGFYAFENAMYNTAIGSYSDIVRTRIGYHIIKVLDERPSRGEVEVAHIFLKKKKDPKQVDISKLKIDSVYQMLKEGADFEELAKKYSDDKKTISKGGYIGWFGIKRYDINFEDQAFGIENPGDFSEVFETGAGYHIVKQLNKRNFESFKRVKGRIENKLAKDDRISIAKKALVEEIKLEANFEPNDIALSAIIDSVDETFFSFKWEKPAVDETTLFQFGNKAISNHSFLDYCKKNTRKRLAFKKTKPIQEAVEELYDSFVGEKALEFEESNLENKYPEFKSLMREYEEGILLFEITKREVWDKASKDTIGLKNFHAAHKEDYQWEKRMTVWEVEVKSRDSKLLKDIRKSMKDDSREELLANYNSKENQLINVKEKTYEKSDENKPKLKWKENHIEKKENGDGTTMIYMVKEIMEARQKELNEARGYIIADYQDQLEKDWIAMLMKKYTVDINDEVFKSLIK